MRLPSLSVECFQHVPPNADLKCTMFDHQAILIFIDWSDSSLIAKAGKGTQVTGEQLLEGIKYTHRSHTAGKFMSS